MGTFVNENATFEATLKEFTFTVPLEPAYKEFLDNLGYQKCQGDGAYSADQKVYVIAPFTNKYWPARGFGEIDAQVVDKVFKTKRLERKLKK